MEVREITSIKPASYNPRTMSNHDAESLKRSIEKFGDISGITSNRRTGNICTGHQRINTLLKAFGPARVQINVISKLEQPDIYGTIATGFVVVTGTSISLAYREIDVDDGTERSMNIAANRVQGEFQLDALAELNYEISQLENGADLLKQTGQTDDEIESMLKMNGAIDDTPEQPKDELDQNKLEFALTADQREIVEEAIGNIKATRKLQAVQPRNLNGAALFTICQDFLNALHNKQEAPADAPEQPNSISIA